MRSGSDGGGVLSARRTLRLFEVFAEAQRPLSLTELADALGIAKSSGHALAGTLADAGYLYALSSPRGWYPTRKLAVLMERVSAHDAIVASATSLLEGLRDRTGETVLLGKRQGDAVIYLEVFESAQAIRYSARQGDRKPLHSSAIGKAMLGTLSDAELRDALATLRLPKVTDATLTDAKRLFADVTRSKRRGWYHTQGENVRDVWAIAATVALGREHVAVAIAGPQHRMKPQLARSVRDLLGTCARWARSVAT